MGEIPQERKCWNRCQGVIRMRLRTSATCFPTLTGGNETGHLENEQRDPGGGRQGRREKTAGGSNGVFCSKVNRYAPTSATAGAWAHGAHTGHAERRALFCMHRHTWTPVRYASGSQEARGEARSQVWDQLAWRWQGFHARARGTARASFSRGIEWLP